ncbi:MAG: hypothetical protein JWO86_7443 [Myxococcaceae bacterium]|nr:hypothetical protein [Myxococcaceae bacterium]
MNARPSARPGDPVEPTYSVHSYALEKSIADEIASALTSEAQRAEPDGAQAEPLPGGPNDAVDPAGIPTCMGGLVGAAITVVVVAAAGLLAVSAYRRPVVHSVMSSIARPQALEVRTIPALPTGDSVGDLDSLGEATETSETAATGSLELDATQGVLELPPAAEGHRVWVDGHLVVVASSRIAVACGRHAVKIGSRGREQQVVAPCGAAMFIAYP